MKKQLISAMLLCISANGFCQDFISDNKIKQLTAKNGSYEVLHVPNHPGVFYKYSGYPKFSSSIPSSSCTCSIQDAYDNGNTISDIYGNQTYFTAGEIGFSIASTLECGLSMISGAFNLSLRSPHTSFYANLKAPDWQTSNQTFTFPVNESGELMLQGGFKQMWIHHPINVNQGTNFQYNGITTKDNLGNEMTALLDVYGDPQLRLNDPLSNFETTVKSSILLNPITVKLPINNGTLINNNIGSNTQVVSGVTSITIIHGMTFIPSNIDITPTSFLPSGGQWKRGAITLTSFTIDFSIPQTGTLSFDYFCHP